MKGNKLKVKNIPCAMSLYICRSINQGGSMTKSQQLKGEKSLGFTKMAKKMIRLGYKPKYAEYESDYDWMRVGGK